jgi:flagellar protein FlaJ
VELWNVNRAQFDRVSKSLSSAYKKIRFKLLGTLFMAAEDISLEKYFSRIFLPLVVFGVLTSAVLKFFVFEAFKLKGLILLLPYLLPLLCLFIAIGYPFYYVSSKGKEIDSKIHLFNTYLGVLSTTGSDKKALFRMAAEKEEYGVIAKEIRKMLKIADSWNMGFVKACKVVGKATPSIIFKDFLDRLAHAIRIGANIEDFLRSEVHAVMDDYERMYRQALYRIDSLKETYIHVIITLGFISAFSLIFPLLVGYELTSVMHGVIFLFLAADVVTYFFIRHVTPKDELFHKLPIKSAGILRIQRMIAPVAVLTFLIFIILYTTRKFPLPITIAISQTPWIIIGILAGREERLIKRKDDNFPAFIRTVGTSAGVRGGSITPIIASLRRHDYGPLTSDIRALYRRLTLGNISRSWRFFAGESGSNLIDKFSRIFIETTYAGGDPAVTGETLSRNFSRINNLRKFRIQSANALRGMLYSSMLGVSISIYITVSLVVVLKEIFMKYTLGTGWEYLPNQFAMGTLDVDYVFLLVWVLILVHAALSSVIIKIVDGGEMYNAFVHYVTLTWMGAIVAIGTPWVFQKYVPL